MSRILVVDDEPEIVKILDTFLCRSGFTVTTASGGERALEILRSDKKIDLMVIDMKMPGMKGMDVLRQMRKQGKKIPVIILTGSIDLEKYANDLRKIGYASDDALLKPIDLEVFLDKVREKLERKQNKGASHVRKDRV